MHLFGIIIIGLLIGSMGLLSSLGIQEQYGNINKPAKNPDFVCREIPKKQPRDIELGHYAKTNDMTACPKDNHVHPGLLPDKTKKILSHAKDDANNVGATSNMTNDQMLLAASLYAKKRKNEPIADDELKKYIASGIMDVSQMLNKDSKESFATHNSNLSEEQIAQAVAEFRRQMSKETDPNKVAQGVEGIRFQLKLKELSEKQDAAEPDQLQPWNKNKSKCGSFKPNYGCLNIKTENYNPVNSERCGSKSLEGHRNRFTHQTTRSMVGNRQEDYILKTKIVPPVCPKCPECPALEDAIKLLQKKQKKKDDEGVEEELEDNELEDSPSALARSHEKRKRTGSSNKSDDPAQYPSPGIKEAAERHEPKHKKKKNKKADTRPMPSSGGKAAGYPNEGAFAGNSSFPIPFLNSFSSFGR